ncbi:MAG: hypothetical protein IJD28_08105 [Deferribacterales bacterium]|nr:hypothetical protein [Deferribacterales bacterium]
MDSERKSRYEQLYNIKLPELYSFVNEVMHDFSYSLHRTIKDHENRRRIESWAYQSREDQCGLVWIEVVKPGESLDPYLTTDVLRTMNDENVTRLFFFTNGQMAEDEKEILEGANHFVFGTDEIVETLIAIDMKRSIKVVRKRKKVKVPSALVLIKNFLKANKGVRKEVKLRTSAVSELVGQYVRLTRRILGEIDRVPDINDIPPETRERLKKIQFDLLPELVKTPGYLFTRQFAHLRNSLFTLMEYTIVYIGNVIEYEAEDDLKKNREIIEEILHKLSDIDDQVASYKSDMMFSAEKISLKVIMYSAVFAFIALLIMIVLRFS